MSAVLQKVAVVAAKLPAGSGTLYRVMAIKTGAASLSYQTTSSEAAYVLVEFFIKAEWSVAIFYGTTNVTDKFTERYFNEHGERHR
jgi:hypothetical protein